MLAKLIGISIALLVLAGVFTLLQRLWPVGAAQRWLGRPGFRGDLTYWFVNPIITHMLAQAAMLAVLVPVFLMLGWRIEKASFQGFGFLGRQPAVLQVVEVLILGDFLGYWGHRLFHRGRLWPFHAVHHSATYVDWFSAVRVHPVNEIIMRVLGATAFVLLGFSPGTLAAYAPFLTVYALMIHANVNWDFGPFRYVLASPAFHRWHHAADGEARQKNFSGFLPIWDLLFGTFYMPPGRHPAKFGVDDPVPTGFWAQIAYPFRYNRAHDSVADRP